jgi:hypothetical protein
MKSSCSIDESSNQEELVHYGVVNRNHCNIHHYFPYISNTRRSKRPKHIRI